jgi:patatin-like phospholipase/acyl hydrolase
MSSYRILSLDGGGIRGVLSARLLQKIVDSVPAFLEKVDLYAGTSVGAINAVGLAAGLPPAKLVELYQQKGRVIFHDTLLHEVGDLWGATGAKYTTKGRLDGIEPTIGEGTLGDLPKRVLVTTFELDSRNPIAPERTDKPQRWKAKFFHNFQLDNDGKDNPDLDQKAIDVVLRSSAAPTYFPIYQGFVDGGVVANNPSMCALAQAVNPNTGQQEIENVIMTSIGTGLTLNFSRSQDGDWGLLQWGSKLIDILFEASIEMADYQSSQLLRDRFKRLNPRLRTAIGLDAVDRVQELIDIADKESESTEFQTYLKWVSDVWMN